LPVIRQFERRPDLDPPAIVGISPLAKLLQRGEFLQKAQQKWLGFFVYGASRREPFYFIALYDNICP
jgi:hypothetical protein